MTYVSQGKCAVECWVAPEVGNPREFVQSPWGHFLAALSPLGEIVPNTVSCASPSAVILIGVSEAGLKRARRFSNATRILILPESPVVRPDWYRSRVLQLFQHVWTPSVMLADEVGGRAYTWPQRILGSQPPVDMPQAWRARSNSALLLLANKYSTVEGEGYSLRRDIARVAKREGKPLTLVGGSWESAIREQLREAMSAAVRTFRARRKLSLSGIKPVRLPSTGNNIRVCREVSDKHAFARRFKVNVVIENDRRWVTEKLVDAITAGCLVIYSGPRIQEFGYAEDICLQVPPKAHAVWEAWDYLSQIGTDEALLKVRAAQDFIWTGSFPRANASLGVLASLGHEVRGLVDLEKSSA